MLGRRVEWHVAQANAHAPRLGRAAAFTTLGGWGRTVRKQLHTLYAKKKKEEKKAGGSGWDTIRWKQDLLERTCIAIAIANFRLLDAHTRAS